MRALGAAILTMGVLGVPSVAQAADKDPADLVVAKGNVARVNQGETVPVAFGVQNRGTAPVEGVVLRIIVSLDAGLPKEFSNCIYAPDGKSTYAYCLIEQTLSPGGIYAVDTFHVTADADASADGWSRDSAFSWDSKEWIDSQGGFEKLSPSSVHGTGATLRLVPAQLSPGTGVYGQLPLSLVKPADDLPLVPLTELDANGQPAGVRLPLPAEGEVFGPEKPVVIGVKNTGSTPIARAVVEIALSTQDVRAPWLAPNCFYWDYKGEDRGVWCTIDEVLQPGQTYRLSPFTVAVDARPKWPTKLTLTWHSRAWADYLGGVEKIAVPSGHGVVGFGGQWGKGGENLHLVPADLPLPKNPQRSATIVFGPDDGSVSPSPSTSATPTPSASSPQPPPGDGGTGGGLPITGAATAPIVAIGAGLLLAGAATLFLTRRRRARHFV